MMKQPCIASFSPAGARSFFPTFRICTIASFALAGVLALPSAGVAQVTGSSQTTTGPDGRPQESITLAAPLNDKGKGKSKSKDDKVVQTKDTKKEMRKEKKDNPLIGVDSKLPDKQLYDKALDANKHGRYDVARLDLQTLLNTYPDSQFQMRAKLAIADTWYREGGTAALTQAESEYKDFITFFPNAPEAAEAQMRVGDIYFRQMDKPDRDYAKAVHAQEEYRLMLQQFPESTLVPDAKQRLRDVQEVLATRESSIAAFYSTHDNWAATIARYQTVADTYPQYSHMDDTLVGLGDAYEAEARFVRQMKLPEAAKARLERTYDEQAADAYRKVVLEHSAAPHVEDAKDRLAAMNLPIPTPTAEQAAASTALENSRQQYKLTDRAKLLVFHKPDVVQAARVGDPSLVDPATTMAPQISRKIVADFNAALNPASVPPAAAANGRTPVPVDSSPAPAAPPVPSAPLQLQDVPTAGNGNDGGASTSTMTTSPATSATGNPVGTNSIGVEIVSPTTPPPATPTTPTPTPRADDPNGGLKAVGPQSTAPLSPVEKAGAAPDAVNDIAGSTQSAAQAPAANGKKTKPAFDKADESSSKHKKKKGLKKLNPL